MITTHAFGTTKTGIPIFKYLLQNKNGFEVHLLNYGLTIQKILFPTKNDCKQDIVLGFDDVKTYEEHTLFIGGIIGRNANRLSQSKIHLSDGTVDVSVNEGANQLHGGDQGFHKQIWDIEVIDNQIKATYVSADGEEGFPGEVKTEITIELTENDELLINMHATTDKETVVNLTRHDYFNLKDGGASDIKDHQIQLNASAYTPTNSEGLPTGDIIAVENQKAFDLRKPVVIKNALTKYAADLPIGYDHNFGVNNTSVLKNVAIAKDPDSGRKVEIWSTQPGLQFYTGRHITDIQGKNNHVYKAFHGLCLETQHFPDATKFAHFKSSIIRPEAPYEEQIIYKFFNL